MLLRFLLEGESGEGLGRNQSCHCDDEVDSSEVPGAAGTLRTRCPNAGWRGEGSRLLPRGADLGRSCWAWLTPTPTSGPLSTCRDGLLQSRATPTAKVGALQVLGVPWRTNGLAPGAWLGSVSGGHSFLPSAQVTVTALGSYLSPSPSG